MAQMSIHRNAKHIFESPQTPIQQCFAGAVILVTGGTGFLGKVLIEKLLWSCPDVKKIYILIRSKKNKTPEERLQEIFDSKVFIRVSEVKPNFREYISIVYGDFEKEGLGLSEEHKRMIKSEVNIVFHTAATVRFDEKMRLASRVNILGTIHMLELCKQINNLQVFVHVSTAYSHCNKRMIDEQFYECAQDPVEFLDYVSRTTDEELDTLTPKLIGEWPNTYSFTKCLSEEMVRRSSKEIPTVVYRPSIVIGSWREPHAGWIDNIYGPTGMMVGVAYGVIRVAICDLDNVTDVVPVDMVCNGMIAAAWDKSTHKEEADTVFNCVSGQRNPLTWRHFIETNMLFADLVPHPQSLWYPVVHCVKSELMAFIYLTIFHYIPGVLIDCLLMMKGDKPKMMRIYKKYTKLAQMLRYFAVNEWKFDDANIQTLFKKMTDRDREIFPFDVEAIYWDDFLYNKCKEVRRSLFNLQDSSIISSKIRNNRLKILHKTLVHIFWLIILYFVYRILF